MVPTTMEVKCNNFVLCTSKLPEIRVPKKTLKPLMWFVPGTAASFHPWDAEVFHRSWETRLGQGKLQAHLVAWGHSMGQRSQWCPHRGTEAAGVYLPPMSVCLQTERRGLQAVFVGIVFPLSDRTNYDISPSLTSCQTFSLGEQWGERCGTFSLLCPCRCCVTSRHLSHISFCNGCPFC